LDSTCRVCLNGYSLINKSCVQCADENCMSCTADSSVCDATGCLDGYIFGAKNKLCLPCATGCKQCQATDISACIGCNSGYYAEVVSGVNTCTRCFTNCDECSNATTCLKCTDGYVASSDGTSC